MAAHPIYNMFKFVDSAGKTVLYPLTCQSFTFSMLTYLGLGLDAELQKQFDFALAPPRGLTIRKVRPEDQSALEYARKIDSGASGSKRSSEKS